MVDQLSVSQIKKYLSVNPKPAVQVFNAIDSTQTYVLKHRFVRPRLVVTDHQTNGHGQRGHRFYSPHASGIYMTLALPARKRFIVNPGILTAGLGVAVVDAVQPFVDAPVRLKWMNDISCRGRKCGGLLVETNSDRDNLIRSFVIGLGLNLYTHRFPKSIKNRAGYLFNGQPLVSRNQLIAKIYNHISEIYTSRPKTWLLDRYQKLLLWRNRQVSFRFRGAFRTGVIRGIDARARLMIVKHQRKTYHLSYRDASQIRLKNFS